MTQIETLAGHLSASLSKNWWLLLLRGLISIAFGILLITQPKISLAALIMVFGIFSLTDGVFTAWSAVSDRKEEENWILLFISGLIGIAIGIIALTHPGTSALVLLFYVATWSIVTGVLNIVTAVRLRKEIEGEWWLALAGSISVLFGFYLITNPGAGILSVLWILGVYAILFGILLCALSFKVKSFGKKLQNIS